MKTRARRRLTLLLAWKARRDRRYSRQLAHQVPTWRGRSSWLGGTTLADIQRFVDEQRTRIELELQPLDGVRGYVNKRDREEREAYARSVQRYLVIEPKD
jgi:hypothetical protein